MSRSLTGLILAAGLSSRFGGQIKGLTVVGVNGECLLALTLRQLKNAGVTDFCIITSRATRAPLEALLEDCFLDLPVTYAEQVTPIWRLKPLGTVDAVLAARSLLHSSFVVVNADTIYGQATLQMVCAYMLAHAADTTACCPGYLLRVCLPDNGSAVNRAILSRDSATQHLLAIAEQYDISAADVGPRFTGDELTSLNVFGFRPAHLDVFAAHFAAFLVDLETEKQASTADPKWASREFILAHVVNSLKSSGNFDTVVLGPTADTPLEITHPQDVPLMIAALRHARL